MFFKDKEQKQAILWNKIIHTNFINSKIELFNDSKHKIIYLKCCKTYRAKPVKIITATKKHGRLQCALGRWFTTTNLGLRIGLLVTTWCRNMDTHNFSNEENRVIWDVVLHKNTQHFLGRIYNKHSSFKSSTQGQRNTSCRKINFLWTYQEFKNTSFLNKR